MKIRTGFVSNSSTSSFCIYGTFLETDQLLTMFTEEEIEDNIYEAMTKRMSSLGLKLEFHSPYDDTMFVGVSWSDIGDDETGAQFKKKVENLIEQFYGQKLPCATHEEAWN